MNQIKPLTPKQKKLLDSLKYYISENGYPPTLREIALMINENGSALSTAQYYVEVLKEKGYLDKVTGTERGISYRNQFIQIPKLGIIAAGQPIEPIEEQVFIEIPSNIKISQPSQHYALEVKGDSMMDMGILNGDTVIIKHQLYAYDKDVIVAITENGATLKVYRNQAGRIWLEPRNNTFNCIYPKSLEIRGIFVGLIR